MEETEIREAVSKMNLLLSDEMSQEHSFWFQSNDFMDVVLFDDIVLWNSENDDRKYLGEETDTYEPLEDCLKREFDKYAARVASISLVPKIEEKLQHLYNDISMLKSGQWVPDDDSCVVTLIVIEEIAEELNINLEYSDEE